MRRPMTRTGTNLLGLVKHLIGMESTYLGENFGRPFPEPLPWYEDGRGWDNEDMWATTDEPSGFILVVEIDRDIGRSDIAVRT